MANEVLGSILSKQNSKSGSWKDLAMASFSGNSKSSNRKRNALGFSFLVNLVENKWGNKAIQNLQESDKQKTFELANLTQKWNGYSNLINDDKAYQADKNYFYKKAEGKWGETNPNYDTETQGIGGEALKIKNQEIKDLQTRYEEIHNQKLTTGKITSKNYMTKETFFKPFEDYYSEEAKRIVAPKNLSVIHNGWSKVREKFKNTDADNAESVGITIAEANRNTFGYLVEPDEIRGSASIEAYRKGKKGFDTTEIKMDIDTAKVNILNMPGIETSQKNYLIKNIGDQSLTKNALQAKIVTLSADFDPYVEQRNVANNSFDKRWTDSGKALPKIKTPEYQEYVLRKINNADIVTKQGDKELNELRSNMFMLKDLQVKPDKNKAMINVLENKIREAGLGKVQIMALNTAMSSITDPNVIATLEVMSRGSDKTLEQIKQEHLEASYKAMLDFGDSILNLDE